MMQRFLQALGLVVWCVVNAVAQDAAAVVSVEGKVYAMSAGTQRELKAEERLAGGALVTTERNAKVVLKLAGGATVQLGAEGEVFLEDGADAADGAERVRLKLLRGEVVGTVPARTAGGLGFEVATPVGTVVPATDGEGVLRLRFGPTTPGMLRFVLAAAKGDWVLTAEGGQRKTVAAGRVLAFDVQVRTRETGPGPAEARD